MDKPTREQVERARQTVKALLDCCTSDPDVARYVDGTEAMAIRTLLDATAPDPGPPRPDDMAELARLVAVELRTRGIWAAVGNTVNAHAIRISRPTDCMERRWHSMLAPDFDNLTPRECADVIQREEAARAAEWASDT